MSHVNGVDYGVNNWSVDCCQTMWWWNNWAIKMPTLKCTDRNNNYMSATQHAYNRFPNFIE